MSRSLAINTNAIQRVAYIRTGLLHEPFRVDEAIMGVKNGGYVLSVELESTQAADCYVEKCKCKAM